MKKLIITLFVCTVGASLSSCTYETVATDNVVYNPGFSNDYVYSVNYYGNRPYWGNNYYYSNTNYNLNRNGYWGYWGGGYYNGY